MNTFGFNQPFGLSGGRIRLGYISGSISIAQILYSDPFTYTLDESGNSIVTNQGSGSDMLMYSGRYLDLVNQATDIPIHHTLGEEKAINGGFDLNVNGWVADSGNTLVWDNGTASITANNQIRAIYCPTSLVPGRYLVTFDLKISVSRSITVEIYDGNSFSVEKYNIGIIPANTNTNVSKEFTIDVTNSTYGAYINIKGVDYNETCWWDNISFKQITNPNSFLTYWNVTTNALVNVDCSTLDPSQKYTLDNIKVSNILATTNAPSASDITKINSNPKLLGALALNNTIHELDWVLDGTQKYYPCFEVSDKYVVDAKSVGTELVINRTFDTDTTGWTGFTWQSGGTVRVINTGTLTYGRTAISTVIGETYIFLFDYIANTAASNALVRLGTSVGGLTVLNVSYSSSNFGTKVVTFTALSTTTYVQFSSTSNTNLTYTEWDNISIRPATASEISNYTTTARKKSHNKGIQTTAFTLDAIGVPTAYDVSKFNFYSNEYGNSQTNLSTVGNFWLEEVIGSTIYQHKFDGTNLTTYTNNVAGTPTAHTPENANYLVGKGVYPKVTANPLATYTQSVFNLYTDGLYTSYNQSARYTALGGV